MHLLFSLRLIVIILIVCCVTSFLLDNSGNSLDVRIRLQHPVSSTGPRYVGITVGANLLLYGNISRLDVHSQRLQSMLQALSPAYLRFGGTNAERLIFNASISDRSHSEMGRGLWDKVNQMARLGNLDLVFHISALVRTGGHWDPSNAHQLLQYSQQHGYDIACFHLGNEPGLFHYQFKRTVTPQMLVHDYKTFKTFLQEFPRYRSSCVYGPEVTNILKPAREEFFTQFLQAGGASHLSGVSLHHYYHCSESEPITEGYFTNHSNLDSLAQHLDMAKNISQHYAPHVPLWLSETGTVVITCPGNPKLRNTFLDGFLWLDKLGMSARKGYTHVLWHQFFSQFVVSTADFTPYTEFYLTVLYKRLVQGPVFEVLTTTPTVRLYAHCANPDSYDKGAVVVYFINLENTAVTLTFRQFTGQQLDLYMLSPGANTGPTSRFIALNGQRLTMSGHDLPPMPPKTVRGQNAVKVAGKTYGFVVIPHANVQVCRDQ